MIYLFGIRLACFTHANDCWICCSEMISMHLKKNFLGNPYANERLSHSPEKLQNLALKLCA